MILRRSKDFMHMYFKNKNKFIIDQNTCDDWCIDDGEVQMSYPYYWLRLKDYRVCIIYEILHAKKYLENARGKKLYLSYKRMKEWGYVPLEGKSYDWYINSILRIIDCQELVELFDSVNGMQRWILFRKFLDHSQLHLYAMYYRVWWEYLIMVSWCKKNHINYRIYKSKEFPPKRPDKKLREEMIKVLNKCSFIEEFSFLNDIELR